MPGGKGEPPRKGVRRGRHSAGRTVEPQCLTSTQQPGRRHAGKPRVGVEIESFSFGRDPDLGSPPRGRDGALSLEEGPGVIKPRAISSKVPGERLRLEAQGAVDHVVGRPGTVHQGAAEATSRSGGRSSLPDEEEQTVPRGLPSRGITGTLGSAGLHVIPRCSTAARGTCQVCCSPRLLTMPTSSSKAWVAARA